MERRQPNQSGSSWSTRYGATHQLQRVQEFPRGMQPPKRVRIYARQDHYVLQWWDARAKRTLNHRINGDLVDAIAHAREIDARLEHFKSAGHGVRNLKHGELIDLYLEDLRRRADAGEVTVATVDRYATALARYRSFANQSGTQRAFPYAPNVNRDFQLAFAAYLEQLQIVSNGHSRAGSRPLRGKQFVLDTARSMYEWAADPLRGNLMPAGFHNPFQIRGRSRHRIQLDQFGEPDITIPMATAFVDACDPFQLRLFAPIMLCGLRAAEPAFIFQEHIDHDWLRVVCVPELSYQTKGRRDKRFPLVGPLIDIVRPLGPKPLGLLYTRRGLEHGNEHAPLLGESLTSLIGEFERRCAALATSTAAQRLRIRDTIIKEAGGLTYDHIQAEFGKLAAELKWPVGATLKDFRHLFSTCLENAGMPEYYRRYLMGQSPGKAAIVTYTHLNELRARYEEVVVRTLAPIVNAIAKRGSELFGASA